MKLYGSILLNGTLDKEYVEHFISQRLPAGYVLNTWYRDMSYYRPDNHRRYKWEAEKVSLWNKSM